MRHRIPAIIVMLLALIGLSASAASAASAGSVGVKPHALVADTCIKGKTYGPWHLEPNSRTTLALSYHGPGNLITVASTGKGDSHFVCVDPSGIFIILNNVGNCIRMTDQSNDYQVMEETGCLNDNTNYQFQQTTVGTGVYQFMNVHFQKLLGTESCPSADGDVVEGIPSGVSGTCVNWVKAAP